MIESIPLDNNGKELKGSKGAEGREYINLLFRLEEEMAGMSAEESFLYTINQGVDQRKYLK